MIYNPDRCIDKSIRKGAAVAEYSYNKKSNRGPLALWFILWLASGIVAGVYFWSDYLPSSEAWDLLAPKISIPVEIMTFDQWAFTLMASTTLLMTTFCVVIFGMWWSEYSNARLALVISFLITIGLYVAFGPHFRHILFSS